MKTDPLTPTPPSPLVTKVLPAGTQVHLQGLPVLLAHPTEILTTEGTFKLIGQLAIEEFTRQYPSSPQKEE